MEGNYWHWGTIMLQYTIIADSVHNNCRLRALAYSSTPATLAIVFIDICILFTVCDMKEVYDFFFFVLFVLAEIWLQATWNCQKPFGNKMAGT